MSLALVSGISGPATEWSARAASYAVLPVAAIEQTPSTVGIAEGHDLYLMSEADIARTLDAMQALGVKNVRVGIFWAAVEGEEGVFNWDNVDRMVDAATARGMGILATILYTPPWAGATQPPAETEWASHPDPVKFGNFVKAVAEEYEGRISTYEIWNEPTGSIFWNPVDPKAYTDILKAGYQAIKAVDPSAIVIAGSVVAGPTYSDGSAVSPVDFLAGMYDNGAHGYFDAISYHPYQHTMSFSNGANQPDEFEYPIEQLHAMRALMIAKGDGDLKVWITEYGQPTNTVFQNMTLTEQQQADYIEDLLRTWQNIDGAGPVFIYQTRDTGVDSNDREKNFGLYDFAWNPKLAASVLAKLIKEFNPTSGAANPLKTFLQKIVQTVTKVLAFIPNLITQVVRAVVNFVGSVFGINRAPTVVSPHGARLMPAMESEATQNVSLAGSGQKNVAEKTESRTGTGSNTDGVEQADVLGTPEPVQQPDAAPQPTVQVTEAVIEEVTLPAREEPLPGQDSPEDAFEPDPGVETGPETPSIETNPGAETGSTKPAVSGGPKTARGDRDRAVRVHRPATPDRPRTR